MSNGDIALASPVTVASLLLGEINIILVPSAVLTVTFFETDGAGRTHLVRITNVAVTGFDLTAGVFTEGVTRALAGYLTTILGVIFVGDGSTLNQRKTALVTRLRTDNVITVAGTVA